MIRRCRRWFTDNLGLKIIALAVAFLIWLFVTNSNDPERTILISNVPVTLMNEDSIADIGKVVDPEGSGTVTLRVTERKSVLSALSKTGADFTVTADLESITEMGTVPLTVSCSNPAITWDEVEVAPASLKVTLEDKVEQAYPITVVPSGTAATGYTVGTTEIEEGKTILLAGSTSLMKIIDRVSAPINISGLGSEATLRSVLEVYDKNGSKLTESQMKLLEFKTSEGEELTDYTVNVLTTMWKIQTGIELDVDTEGEVADGYTISGITTIPETISLAGTNEALHALGGVLALSNKINVQGESSSIEQEVDLTDTLTGRIDLKLLADADPTVTVQVQIERSGDVTIDIPLSEIVINHAPKDKKLVFTPADKISVGIHADDPTGQMLTKRQIKLEADLAECDEDGTYEVPVKVSLPKGYRLSAEVTLKVSVSSATEPQSEQQETKPQGEEEAQSE